MNQRKAFLLLIVGITAALAVFVVLPFVEYVLAALLLAYALYPLKRRLEPRLGATVASLLSIVVALVVFIAPLTFVTFVVVQDAVGIAGSANLSGFDIARVEEAIVSYTGYEVDLTGAVADVAQGFVRGVFGSLSQIFGILVRFGLGMMITVFLVYYLLKDGARFVDWSRGAAPLPDDIVDRLYERLGEMTYAVLYGHLLVAVVQALLAGAGLAVAGVPNALFWTFVMVFLAVLPVIGVFLVWGPASAYLFLTGSTTEATALAIYGVTVVSITDNYLRSVLVDRDIGLSPGVVLVGVLGGVYAMGVIGLFVGPVILGALKATVSVYRNNYDSL